MAKSIDELEQENMELRDKINKDYVSKKDLIGSIISELVKMKIIKPSQDPFICTKNLLSNYDKLNKSISHHEKEIKRLKKAKNQIDGPQFKKSTLEISESTALPTLDVINNRILDLSQTIEKIKCFLSQIDEIIYSLEDEDREILIDYYLKNVSPSEISDKLGYDQSTTYRKINKAIDKIKVELFPNKFIDSLL